MEIGLFAWTGTRMLCSLRAQSAVVVGKRYSRVECLNSAGQKGHTLHGVWSKNFWDYYFLFCPIPTSQFYPCIMWVTLLLTFSVGKSSYSCNVQGHYTQSCPHFFLSWLFSDLLSQGKENKTKKKHQEPIMVFLFLSREKRGSCPLIHG